VITNAASGRYDVRTNAGIAAAARAALAGR
jgi:hypothetical protein